MTFKSKYDFGQILYLKTDVEQLPRIITRIMFNYATVAYELSCGTTTSEHYEYEVAEEKDVLITSDN